MLSGQTSFTSGLRCGSLVHNTVQRAKPNSKDPNMTDLKFAYINLEKQTKEGIKYNNR